MRLWFFPALTVACFGACGAILPRPAGSGEEQGGGPEVVEEEPNPVAGPDAEPPVEPEAPPVPAGLDADAVLALTPDECFTKLDEWEVPYERVDDAPATIDAPIRLTGPLAGVTYAVPWTVTNHHDVLDCRLALALAEWSVLLHERGVVEVRIYSFYRAGSRGGVTSRRAQGQPSQHSYGLAIDAGWFVKADGDVLSVLDDWVDPGTEVTCGGSVDAADGAALLDLYCSAWSARLFHVQLSPAHNQEHENHFHLDVGGGGGGWYLD
ncbi:MAG: extensin family protein [Deltaproteobacteria bacterium]|nr:extensin family protein [Deltaproteobacteria bacterium]